MNIETLTTLHNTMKRTGRDWDSADREKVRNARLASRAFHDAQRVAIAEFAAGRGWQVAKHQFTPAMLAAERPGRSTRDDYCWQPPTGSLRAWDHPYFFRETSRPYRPAGIVVHLYADSREDADQFASACGLVFEPLAWSWYYPGSCLAGVYTQRRRQS